MLWWGGLVASDWKQNAVAVSGEHKNDYPADKEFKILRNFGNYLIIYTAFILVATSLL